MSTQEDIKLAVTRYESRLGFSGGIGSRFLKQVSVSCRPVAYSNEVASFIVQTCLQCRKILDQALCFIK